MEVTDVSKVQEHTAIAYDKRGKIISIGRNSYVRTHPLQADYARRVGRPSSIYIHAEIDAIIRAKGRKIHKLLVTRVNAHGDLVLSKPCAICEYALASLGITNVEHS